MLYYCTSFVYIVSKALSKHCLKLFHNFILEQYYNLSIYYSSTSDIIASPQTEPLEELSYSPRGDLILALKFVPPDALAIRKSRRSRGALHVLVKEAKSLAPVRPHGLADPICKG